MILDSILHNFLDMSPAEHAELCPTPFSFILYPLYFFPSPIVPCTLYIVFSSYPLYSFYSFYTFSFVLFPLSFLPIIISSIRTIPCIPNQRLWTGCAKVCAGICPHPELYLLFNSLFSFLGRVPPQAGHSRPYRESNIQIKDRPRIKCGVTE